MADASAADSHHDEVQVVSRPQSVTVGQDDPRWIGESRRKRCPVDVSLSQISSWSAGSARRAG
jgi:hypothetical protein